jgi:hypothetical protein
LTRASINLHKNLSKVMDCRVRPGNDGMDCFAEPVIGRRFAPTRWLAMTAEICDNPADE